MRWVVLVGLSVCVGCERSEEGGGGGGRFSQSKAALLPSAPFDAGAACSACHGGRDNNTGAPPNDLAGGVATTLASVGAHTAHVQAGPMARALGCEHCHPRPAAICAGPHLNNDVDLNFSALATARGTSASYDPATARCTNYCHGAAQLNGTRTNPTWTRVGQGEAACGTCHGIPSGSSNLPSAGHPTVPSSGVTCGVCHPETMSGNSLIPGAPAHVDGVVQAAMHPNGWYQPGSPTGGTHGANLWNGAGPLSMDDYYTSCTQCHGGNRDFINRDGGAGGWSGVSCGQCHPAFFITSPAQTPLCSYGGLTPTPCTSCVFCH